MRHIWRAWRKPQGTRIEISPLKNYCTGLLLPGERKSVEPMAARLRPENVRRMHQSLHHVVADAPGVMKLSGPVSGSRAAGDAAAGTGGGVGGG